MPDRSQTTRYRAIALVVLGILVVLAIFVVVALLNGGDDTDQIDPQNNDDSAPMIGVSLVGGVASAGR
jgi:hypothetical protein